MSNKVLEKSEVRLKEVEAKLVQTIMSLGRQYLVS